MKNRVKRFISCVIFLGFVFVIFLKITYVFSPTGREREAILGIREEAQLDMVYIGASAVYTYWQPLRAWSDYGFTSYNYATGGLPAESLKYYVSEVLKTHNPELFVIDARTFLYWDNVASAKVRYGSDSMNYSSNRFALLNSYFNSRNIVEGDDKLSYYLQIIKYHSNYQEILSNENSWKLINNKQESKYKGWTFMEYYCPLDMPEDIQTEQRGALKEGSQRILDDLLEFCKEKNLKVLFVVSPYDITEEDMAKCNTIKDTVEKQGFDFLNTNYFYDVMNLDFKTDFNDYNHVNCFGAEKYTKYFGDFLSKKYNLTDHRNDTSYATWNEVYEEFKVDEIKTKENVQKMIDKYKRGEQVASLLVEIDDPLEWVSLANNDSFTVIVITVGEWKSDDLEYQAILDQMNINLVSNKYCARAYIGGFNYINTYSDNEIEENCIIGTDRLRKDQTSITIKSGQLGMIRIGDEILQTEQDGVYITVYNNYTNEVEDVVALRCQNHQIEMHHYSLVD